MQQNLTLSKTEGEEFHTLQVDCLRSIVRDRLSSNAAINSIKGISRSLASFRKVSSVGDMPPLNHFDQTAGSTPSPCTA